MYVESWLTYAQNDKQYGSIIMNVKEKKREEMTRIKSRWDISIIGNSAIKILFLNMCFCVEDPCIFILFVYTTQKRDLHIYMYVSMYNINKKHGKGRTK